MPENCYHPPPIISKSGIPPYHTDKAKSSHNFWNNLCNCKQFTNFIESFAL